MPYDLVIFDLDGVLVDSERIATRVEEEFFATLGLKLSADEMMEKFKGKTTEELAREVERLAPKPLTVSWPYDWAMATAAAFVRELRPVDGIEPLLQALRDANIGVAVASQSPRGRVDFSLHITGLEPFFEGRIYTASLVAKPKPAPDLFLHVAHELRVPPKRCCVVEDSPTGVRAGVAAGMTVFGYAADHDPEALRSAGATVFTKMPELRDALERTGAV